MGDALLALGGAALLLSSFLTGDPRKRAAFMYSGGAVLAIALLRLQMRGFAALRSASEGGGIAGIVGRSVFGEPAAGTIRSEEVVTATKRTPKNLLGIVGEFVEPRNGGKVERPLFSDKYVLRFAVANQSSVAVKHPARVVVFEDFPVLADESVEVSTPAVSLAPGQEKVLDVQLRAAKSSALGYPTSTARLYMAGHLLDKISFSRS